MCTHVSRFSLLILFFFFFFFFFTDLTRPCDSPFSLFTLFHLLFSLFHLLAFYYYSNKKKTRKREFRSLDQIHVNSKKPVWRHIIPCHRNCCGIVFCCIDRLWNILAKVGTTIGYSRYGPNDPWISISSIGCRTFRTARWESATLLSRMQLVMTC